MLRIPLFGGAMSAAIPARFVDASRFREVPDNQEVLVDPDTDQSIIVEILVACVAVAWLVCHVLTVMVAHALAGNGG